MATQTQSRQPGIRVFKNELMDKLSRVHPAFPAVFWTPIALAEIAWGLYQGIPWYAAIGLIAGGFFAWTFFEYWLHRGIFHFVPKSRRMRKYYYLVHQIHHEHFEWDRLVAPPLMSFTLWVIFFVLFKFAIGTPTMWPFFAGFTFGYLAYDYIHFYTHFGKPKTRIGKMLRRHHMLHHHAWHDRLYGVSSPFWDYVFRTHVRPGERPPKYEKVEWPHPNPSEP